MPQQLTKDELAEAIAGAVKTPIEALAETLTADFDAKLAELRKPEATPLVVPDDADVKVGEDAILADPKAGFANLGAFALAVARADMGKGVDERLSIAAKQYTIACKTAGVMEEGDDSQGGYLVPVEYRAQLLKNELGASVFLSRARIIPMATNTIQDRWVIGCVGASASPGAGAPGWATGVSPVVEVMLLPSD